MLQPFPFSVKH